MRKQKAVRIGVNETNYSICLTPGLLSPGPGLLVIYTVRGLAEVV